MHDLFEIGYVDVAIFQPTYLTEFFPNGFNTTEQDAVLEEKYPDKFILNGSFDPREGVQGLEQFEEKQKSTASRVSSSTPQSGTRTPRAGSSTITGPTATWRNA